MVSTAIDHVPATAIADKLSTRDKITIGCLVFFLCISPIEGYWVLHHNVMEQQHDLFSRLLSLYWPADHCYRIAGYSVEKTFTLSLETVNTFISQPLGMLLVWAIVKRKRFRHPLQLMLATYTGYGTILYYTTAHASHYAIMDQPGTGPLLIFWLCNLPWLIGCIWMVYDSYRATMRRFAEA